MSQQNKLDSQETQLKLKNKLEDLFRRENLEKDVYLIARMNDKMEIPLQVVYQQKEIYKICPNGRYVLQALKNCDNVIVNQESLYVIPKILPKKVRIYIRISNPRKVSLNQILINIQEKSQIPKLCDINQYLLYYLKQNFMTNKYLERISLSESISHTKVVSPTSAFLTTENEENALELSNWIIANKEDEEPQEIQLREENLYKVFKNNVKEDLNKYYEKLNEDKKANEMYENLSFFSSQSNFPSTTNKNKIGENIFSNPYNYFFFQQPVHETNLQPSIRKSNGETTTLDNQNQQINPLAFMMFQQPQMFNEPQNYRRNNNYHQGNNGQHNKNKPQGQNRSKSRGDGNKKNSLNRSNSRKRQNESGKFSNKKGQKDRVNNRSNEKVNNNNKKNLKSALKTKSQKPLIDNEENFPSLTTAPNTNTSTQNTGKVESSQQDTVRQTRKQSAEKRSNVESSPVQKAVTIKVDEKRERQISYSKERQRQVSESRERQIPSKPREKSASKTEEIVYIRKGKDIEIVYEKESLIEIFKKMKERITAPNSIIQSSKDDFIPVININASKEIEHTKPTEVEFLPLSNPGTPYQGTGSVQYRPNSISRSNVKRKESEKIIEVDENKV